MTEPDNRDDLAETVSYDAMIEDRVVVAEPDEDVVVVEDPAPTRPKWPFILLLGALLGFGASTAASWYLLRPEPVDTVVVDRKIAALESRLAALESAPAPVIPKPQRVDLGPLERRLTAIEQRPVAEPQAIDEDLVARMEALQADGFETAPAVDLSPLEARIEALEARSAPVVTTEKVADPVRMTTPQPSATLVPAFPADALREGAENMPGRGGLFSKHIRVKSENDPLTLIEGIEADMAANELEAAVAKFDRLPSPLRDLARGWRADMRSYVTN